MSARARRRDRGVTIIEILASMAILTIATIGITRMQYVVGQTNRMGRERTQAVQIANRVAEAVMLWSWTDTRLTAVRTSVGAYATPTLASSTTTAMSPTPDYALGNYSGSGAQATKNNQRVLPSGTNDALLPGPEIDAKYRVYWNVDAEDVNSDGVQDSRLITITVRWQEGNVWRNYNLVRARFNAATLIPNFN